MASIVPFDPTVGITAVASVALALFMFVMVFFAVAPLVSSTWEEQFAATSASGAGRSAEPSDD